jgi:hypothetical protein
MRFTVNSTSRKLSEMLSAEQMSALRAAGTEQEPRFRIQNQSSNPIFISNILPASVNGSHELAAGNEDEFISLDVLSTFEFVAASNSECNILAL